MSSDETICELKLQPSLQARVQLPKRKRSGKCSGTRKPHKVTNIDFLVFNLVTQTLNLHTLSKNLKQDLGAKFLIPEPTSPELKDANPEGRSEAKGLAKACSQKSNRHRISGKEHRKRKEKGASESDQKDTGDRERSRK